MAMTRDNFVTEICDVVGKSATAASVSGATLQERVRTYYLNWAQKRIARFYSFHELSALTTTAATVASIKRYPLSAGTNNLGLTRCKDINSIRLIDGENSRTFHRWSQRKFDKHYPRPANYSEGRPKLYVRWGNFIELFRIPDKAYDLSIRYSQWAVDFSSGNQVSAFIDKDELITTTGVFETYLALEEYEDAKVWYGKTIGHLRNAVHAEGDVDWEPQAEPGGMLEYRSGTVYDDPYGAPDDPLYGYQ